MKIPDSEFAHTSIHRRSTLRSMCRNRLSEHIADTLEIDIKPCNVRLKTDNETPYEWHVEDPRIKELFGKQLSKHSVNAFIVLTEEVGHSFWAVRHRESHEKTSQPTLKEQLKAVQAQNLALVERLENAETEVAGRVRDADNLEQKLRIANSTIASCRQEIQRWMLMAEYYRNEFSQRSEGLMQASQLLHGLTGGATFQYSTVLDMQSHNGC